MCQHVLGTAPALDRTCHQGASLRFNGMNPLMTSKEDRRYVCPLDLDCLISVLSQKGCILHSPRICAISQLQKEMARVSHPSCHWLPHWSVFSRLGLRFPALRLAASGTPNLRLKFSPTFDGCNDTCYHRFSF